MGVGAQGWLAYGGVGLCGGVLYFGLGGGVVGYNVQRGLGGGAVGADVFNALRLVAVLVYVIGAFYVGYNNGRAVGAEVAGAFLQFTAGGIVNLGDGFAVGKGYGSGQVEVVVLYHNAFVGIHHHVDVGVVGVFGVGGHSGKIG